VPQLRARNTRDSEKRATLGGLGDKDGVDRDSLPSPELSMRALLALSLFALAPLAAAQDTILFQDDFESGLSNWSTTGLWHLQDVSAPCSSIAAPFPSGTRCAWFGRTSTCTFDTPDVGWGWTDGTLTLNQAVALPAGAASIRFTLRTNSEGEDDQVWDRRSLRVSVVGAGSSVIVGNVISSGWETAVFDLTSYAGQTVHFGLEFWAGDGAANDYYGWFVDDVAVTASMDAATTFCTGDGDSGACPCANLGATGRGCASSFEQQGARLDASGFPSLTNDTLSLQATGVSAAAVTFFAGPSRTPTGGTLLFGDGVRCVTGTLTRLRAFPDAGGVAQIPVASGAPLHVGFSVGAGTPTSYVQALYRNAAPFCTSATFNLTNGLIVTWRP
jgi:hypothetical protein